MRTNRNLRSGGDGVQKSLDGIFQSTRLQNLAGQKPNVSWTKSKATSQISGKDLLPARLAIQRMNRSRRRRYNLWDYLNQMSHDGRLRLAGSGDSSARVSSRFEVPVEVALPVGVEHLVEVVLT